MPTPQNRTPKPSHSKLVNNKLIIETMQILSGIQNKEKKNHRLKEKEKNIRLV